MQANEFHSLFYATTFYFFGLLAIASAIAFVTRKSPVAAAIWLVVVMFSLAALYVMLDAQFIGTMQVFVYTGAIMVVFLFVIMLLNLGQPSELADARGKWGYVLALFVGLAMLAEVMAQNRDNTIDRMIPPDLAAKAAAAAATPSIARVPLRRNPRSGSSGSSHTRRAAVAASGCAPSGIMAGIIIP